jgi:hypothetical protein
LRQAIELKYCKRNHLIAPSQLPWYVIDATGMVAGCVEAKLTLTYRIVLQPDTWSFLPNSTIICGRNRRIPGIGKPRRALLERIYCGA